ADRLECRDPLVELGAPCVREALPVALRRLLAFRERVERVADPLERDPGRFPRLHDGDPPQGERRIAALVAIRAAGDDEALTLVEAQRRLGDTAPLRQLS